MESKGTIALDFDGVLHSYRRGWIALAPEDPPMEGAKEFVEALLAMGYEVLVFTTRAETAHGDNCTHAWLLKHGFPRLGITHHKPKALLYINDRGWRFDGNFAPILAFLKNSPNGRPESASRGS